MRTLTEASVQPAGPSARDGCTADSAGAGCPKQATSGAACARPRQAPDQDCCCCSGMSSIGCCHMTDWCSRRLMGLKLCSWARSCTGTWSRPTRRDCCCCCCSMKVTVLKDCTETCRSHLATRSCHCCCSMKVTDSKGYSSLGKSRCSMTKTGSKGCSFCWESYCYSSCPKMAMSSCCCPRKGTVKDCSKGTRHPKGCYGVTQETLNWTSSAKSHQTPNCRPGPSCWRGCSYHWTRRPPCMLLRPDLKGTSQIGLKCFLYRHATTSDHCQDNPSAIALLQGGR